MGACNGGGSAPSPANQAGTIQFKAAVDAARLARLEPAVLTTAAEVSGKLSLTGIQVVDEAGQPVAGSGFGSIFIRIVDPGDDILSLVEGQPDAQGNFNLQIPDPPLRSLLEVRFKVEADLDGDGIGGDTLRQRVPLTLTAGRRASTQISLRQQLGYQPGVAVPVGETVPVIIAALVETLDATGRRSFGRASNYSAGEVLSDVDGNSSFDPMTDLRQEDGSGDGLSDTSLALYTSPAPFDTIFGVVTRIDQFKREAEVIVKSGDSGYIVNVLIDPMSVVELYLPKTPRGESFAELKPDQFLLGRNVYCDGFFTDGSVQRAMTALSITVLQ
jgi:hypothetical protein